MFDGIFISFEGIEGSGKSTQVELLGRALEGMGRKVCAFREPGGTGVGESIRSLLLRGEDISGQTEALLFAASRAQLIRENILPALETGQVVLLDRFVDSSMAYQGGGRGLGLDAVRALNEAGMDGLWPHRTYLLDVPVDRMDQRFEGRARDRIESEDQSFHRVVRGAFLELARREPDRIVVVDGDRDRQDIHGDILADLQGLVGTR